MPKGVYKHKSLTKETKDKLRIITLKNGNKPPHLKGEKHYNWKGGKPKCLCGKLISTYKVKKCKNCYANYIKVKREIIVCPCGVYFIKSVNRLQTYCSKNCSQYKERLRESHKGKIWVTGENHPNWIKDRSLIKHQEKRNNPEYKHWRLEVYRRDNYKCKIDDCNCSGRIIAHHILSFTHYPELRYNINNGITLCQAHHPLKRAEEKLLVPTFQELISQMN